MKDRFIAVYLANILTGLSLFFGFVSIIFSLESQFTFASWSIVISAVIDGFDGQVARWNPAPKEFGKEFDSLVDVVSFGIAPAILGYTFIYPAFEFWATLGLFVYLACSVVRLARYNITPKEKIVCYFYGLPTTISGGILASFVLMYRRGQDISQLPEYVPGVFLMLALCLAFLMLSRIKYPNLDSLKELLFKRLRLALTLSIILLATAVFSRKAGIAVFGLFLIYLIFSPFVVKRLGEQR